MNGLQSIHAAAWRARALAALRADSSLSVRLRRYNEAMARARSLGLKSGRHADTANGDVSKLACRKAAAPNPTAEG